MYKKIVAAIMLLPCIALAKEKNSLTLGYAHSLQGGIKKEVNVSGHKLKSDANANNGLNAKYRYEVNSRFGSITSLTHMEQSAGTRKMTSSGGQYYSGKVSLKQTSLSAGPTYRFNEYVSIYGTAGAAKVKRKFDVSKQARNNGLKYPSKNTFAPVYSVGMQINPVKNFVIDASVERREKKGGFGDQTTGIIGLGYSF